ncbi:acetylcholinesterase-1-like [Tetranychus urticae]|uniref:Carboxylic ester hydrolase n=1 Tax=Tetranychus urticae TaxID=32264 RepID=T1KJC9_TETUR|nr:acetylcholinesterase-1-like [Tetranychus urticae]
MNWKLQSVFIFLNVVTICSSKLTVKTEWGSIRGFYEKFGDKQIRSFLGIPYALPPVGPLRFRKPIELVKPFKGIYKAKNFGPACLQSEADRDRHTPNSTISENCLFLNVWTPIDASEKKLYPVLIYIHGAAFTFGSAESTSQRGDILTALNDIITVNLNHRLGASGLAYGKSDSIVGNQQVHDVIMALEWVKRNIGAFGGDSNQITLSGMSSGAILASAIFLSPAVKSGLFNKVFLMSGVALDQVAIYNPNKIFKQTKSMSSSLGCSQYASSNDSFQIGEVICLKKVEAKAIADTEENRSFYPIYNDGDIFPESPARIVSKKSFPKGIKFLIGTEADESFFSKAFSPTTKKEALSNMELLISALDITQLNMTNLLMKYFDGLDDDNATLIHKRFDDFGSDLQFHCPSLLYSVAFASNSQNNVYIYRNDYVTSNFDPSERPNGARHSDVQRMFFGDPFRSPEIYKEDRDRDLSRFMMKTLSDFVRGKELFWDSIKINGNQSDKISLPRWRIQNNESFDKVDYDDDKDICLEWAKYYGLQI